MSAPAIRVRMVEPAMTILVATRALALMTIKELIVKLVSTLDCQCVILKSGTTVLITLGVIP